MSKQRQPESAPRAIVRGPDHAQLVDHGLGGALTYWARGEETGGAVTVIETVVAPGMGPPHHVHVTEDEFVYVLEGSLRFSLNDAVHEVPAGSFVFIPRTVPHTWQNVSDGRARFLFGFTPAALGMERFFERGAELAADIRLAESFARFATDAGMQVLGPPLAQSHPPAQIQVAAQSDRS